MTPTSTIFDDTSAKAVQKQLKCNSDIGGRLEKMYHDYMKKLYAIQKEEAVEARAKLKAQ